MFSFLSQAHLISDIDSARKMEGQLLAIQNAIIEGMSCTKIMKTIPVGACEKVASDL